MFTNENFPGFSSTTAFMIEIYATPDAVLIWSPAISEASQSPIVCVARATGRR